MKPYQIHFEKTAFDGLFSRLEAARMPRHMYDDGWEHGTDGRFLEDLLAAWRDSEPQWRQKEEELNGWPQYLCSIRGMDIHFFHIPASRPGGLPVLLTHGWPDSFLRYAKIFSLLPEHDLIVPTLPGFGFSTLPEKGYTNNSEVADIWHVLMRDLLGYSSYIAAGGDMGRGVTCYLASRYPEEIAGIHLTDVGLVRELISAPDDTLSAPERDYKERASKWLALEGAYINIQSTKPQTLAFSLADSPVGMAAWLAEKYHAWSDWPRMQIPDICDCLTLYWMTNTAATAARMYHGNSFSLPPLSLEDIKAPVGFAAFPHDVLPVPESWIREHYPLVRYDIMPYGGHFTALEAPGPFADSLAAFAAAID